MENNFFSGKSAPDEEQSEFNSEDLAQIFNYPSIGQLFDDSDSQRLETFRSRLSDTRENLERIIRYGSRDEAARADKAARAVQITLDFLKTLQKMRLEQNK
ncbi:MAG: hypothetical protein ACR2F2_13030 [Pyrinomonadaceae bacterium]